MKTITKGRVVLAVSIFLGFLGVHDLVYEPNDWVRGVGFIIISGAGIVFGRHMIKEGRKEFVGTRLPLREAYAAAAMSHSFTFLWFGLGTSILFVVVGFRALFVEKEWWGAVVGIFFGLAAISSAYMIKVKKRIGPPLDLRFFTFSSVDLIRIGRARARIVSVMREKVEYIDEDGRKQFVDLEECARICMCLYRSGLFPPKNDTDWTSVADATPGFASLDVSGGGTVGLRGALDTPPWFQFLNRRRTQFDFKNRDRLEKQLLRPLAKFGWQSFDAC